MSRELHVINAEDAIPAAGTTAPEFELPDSTGHPRQLSSLVAERPIILLFYRGHW